MIVIKKYCLILLALRDEMTLVGCKMNDPMIIKENKKMYQYMQDMEDEWENFQDRLLNDKIEKKRETAENDDIKWQKILEKCQGHGGPLKSLAEGKSFIDKLMKSTKDEKEKVSILKLEILFRKKLEEFPSMDYRVNKKNSKELAQTLINLLQHEESNTTSPISTSNNAINDVVFNLLSSTQH